MSSMWTRRWMRAITTSVAVGALCVAAAATTAVAAQNKPPAKAKATGPDIMLMQPKVLKAGENQFEVTVNGVTVSVKQAGKELGQKKVTLTAK